ncbi:MAG: YihY/virulence factor BrkB family protein [Armatimonadota bacterium]
MENLLGMGAGASEHQPLSLLRHGGAQWWRVLRIAYLRFGFSAGVLSAAAIAFFSLICLAPLGILLAAVLQLALGSGDSLPQRLEEALSVLGSEAATAVMPYLLDLLSNPWGHIAGGLSVLTLLWAGLHLFEAVERALTGIWPGRMLRGYLRRKLTALVMLVVGGLLLGGLTLSSAFWAAARGWLQRAAGVDPDALTQLQPPLHLAHALLISFAGFAVLYKFIPVQRVPTRVALVAAGFATALWHLASPIFTWTLRISRQQGTVYGSLTDIVVFGLWCFLGAQILVLGAHLAVAYEHVFTSHHPPESDDDLIARPRPAQPD